MKANIRIENHFCLFIFWRRNCKSDLSSSMSIICISDISTFLKVPSRLAPFSFMDSLIDIFRFGSAVLLLVNSLDIFCDTFLLIFEYFYKTVPGDIFISTLSSELLKQLIGILEQKPFTFIKIKML